jgi:hypothetical protein
MRYRGDNDGIVNRWIAGGGGGGGGGGGTFALPRLGRRIVRANAEGAFTNIPILNDGIMLDDGAHKFEIGIRNGTRRVRPTDKISADDRWETGPPQNGSIVARTRTGAGEFWGRGKGHATLTLARDTARLCRGLREKWRQAPRTAFGDWRCYLPRGALCRSGGASRAFVAHSWLNQNDSSSCTHSTRSLGKIMLLGLAASRASKRMKLIDTQLCSVRCASAMGCFVPNNTSKRVRKLPKVYDRLTLSSERQCATAMILT